MNTDQSLGDTTPDEPTTGSVFQRATPNPTDAITAAAEPGPPLTVAQILEMAKFPERRATVCLRADLQASFDDLVDELTGLVNVDGTVREDAEAALGEETAAARVRDLDQQIQAIRAEMQKSTWKPLFRGISSDELAVFNREHWPKKDGAPLTDYYNRLVARCMVEPEMTVADVEQLRTKLSHRAMQELINTASNVNVGLGVDVPKSPISLQGTEER